ncbi:DUF4912 domain-containing protein [bacterium]|nr:DUF4912 domain-containing protein [bacterium]
MPVKKGAGNKVKDKSLIKSKTKTLMKIKPKKISQKSNRIKQNKENLIQEQGMRSVSTVEETVENSKYYLGSSWEQTFDEKRFVFPLGYSQDKIILLVRDPHWLFAYWDLSGSIVEHLKSEFGADVINGSKMVLRVKDVTDANPDNPANYYDVFLDYGTANWYINVPCSNRSYCTELGFITSDGRYILIIRSNTVISPRDTVSDVVDEEWMSLDFDKLYALSGGIQMGLSSEELRRMMKQRIEHVLSSGSVPSSHILAGQAKQDRAFFLVVNTELVLYGKTVPDAKLTIQDKPIKINEDGSFSIRFALPDGEQNIPVKAISSDDIDEIIITPVVSKETR